MRLIVMREVDDLADGQMTGTAVFRFQVPAGRESYYANADLVSLAPDTDDTELAALQAGSYVEQVASGARYPEETPLEELEQGLAQTWQTSHDKWVANENDRLRYFGSSWDGTTWIVKSL